MLDVEKVFDNVWHDELVHKLLQYQVQLYLMTKNYFHQGTFQIVLKPHMYEVQCVPPGYYKAVFCPRIPRFYQSAIRV